MKESVSNFLNQEQVQNFWKDMSDSKNGMGVKIHPCPHYDLPLINQTLLDSAFSTKTEPAKKNLERLVSYIKDKKIIEDKFSHLPPEIQNPQREAKKKRTYSTVWRFIYPKLRRKKQTQKY